ncbi:MAG: sensor histidine kinase [Chloroflexota bacterium]
MREPRAAAVLAWGSWALASLLGMLGLVFLALTSGSLGALLSSFGPATVVIALTFPAVGAVIASHRPDNRLGWVLCATGLVWGTSAFAIAYSRYALLTSPAVLPAGLWLAWVGHWVWMPGIGALVTFILLFFPDGRLPSPRWRPVAWLGAAWIAVQTVAIALQPGPLNSLARIASLQSVQNPLGIAGAEDALGLTVAVGQPLTPLFMLAAVASVVVRFRRAAGPERQQIKWFAYAGAVMMVALLVATSPLRQTVPVRLVPVLMVLALLAVAGIPAAIGTAVLRYRLYEIDLLINRTLVYGALMAAIAGIYVLTVGAFVAVLQTPGDLFTSLLATGVAAAAFQPLRDRLQRGVNRLLYGERADPYAVISDLGERLDETLADLQRARERLVTAREEERRRLRRDLHDGLGTQLAALSIQAGVLRSQIRRDPAAAENAANELRQEIRAAIASIRRLVYDLRPPALDELGLVGALRERAALYELDGAPASASDPGDGEHHRVQVAHGLHVSIEAPEHLPPLSAAVEVAVYRIVQEALTNVVRHARASQCAVRLSVNGALRLVIADDGVGVPLGAAHGVGLLSMRERAAELGGACAVSSPPSGGTEVRVRLPLSMD